MLDVRRLIVAGLAGLREMPPVEVDVDFTCRACGPVRVHVLLPNSTALCLLNGHGHAVEAVSTEAHLTHDLQEHLDAIGDPA